MQKKMKSYNVKQQQQQQQQQHRQQQWRQYLVYLFAASALLETFLFSGLPYGWVSLIFVFKEEGIYGDLCQLVSHVPSADGTNNNFTSTTKWYGELQSVSTQDNYGGIGQDGYNITMQQNQNYTRQYFDDVTMHSILNATTQVNLGVTKQRNQNLNANVLDCSEQDKLFNLWFGLSLGLGQISAIGAGLSNRRFGTKTTRLIFTPLVIGGTLCMGFTSKELPWLIPVGLTTLFAGGFAIVLTNIRVALFLQTGSAIYVGLLNGCYDSSAIVLSVVKTFIDNGIDRKYSFIGLAVLYIVISSINTFIHGHVTSFTQNIQEMGGATYRPKENGIKKKQDVSIQRGSIQIDQAGMRDLVTKETVKSVFMTSVFWSHLLFAAMLILEFVFFLGSMNTRLENTFKDDKGLVEHFTDVLSYIMMAGIIGSFLSGSLMEFCQKHYFKGFPSRRGQRLIRQVIPLSICSILGILLPVLNLFMSRYVFYVMFVNVILLRSFIYSVNSGFFTHLYDPEPQTFLLGFSLGFIGLVSQAQYALFVWMESYKDALYHVNWLLLGVTSLTCLHPVNVYMHARKENKNKENTMWI